MQRASAARTMDACARILSWLPLHPWRRAGTGPTTTCQHPSSSKPPLDKETPPATGWAVHALGTEVFRWLQPACDARPVGMPAP